MTPTIAQLIAHFRTMSERMARANIIQVTKQEAAHSAACNAAILEILERTQLISEVGDEMRAKFLEATTNEKETSHGKS